jgi:hypothetical protein
MGKNQDPLSGINIPDPQHCLKHDNFSLCIVSTEMYPLQELLLQEAQELLLSTLPSYTGDSSALHPSNTFRKANEADVLRPVVIGKWKPFYRTLLWIRIRIDFWLSWILIRIWNAYFDLEA